MVGFQACASAGSALPTPTLLPRLMVSSLLTLPLTLRFFMVQVTGSSIGKCLSFGACTAMASGLGLHYTLKIEMTLTSVWALLVCFLLLGGLCSR